MSRWPLMFLLAWFVVGCGLFNFGNGEATTETRPVTSFVRVQNGSSLDMNIRIGDAETVRVTVDSNLQSSVRVRVENQVLIVDDVDRYVQRVRGHIDVTLPRLLGATAAGSGDVSISGNAATEDLALDVAGSGSMEVSLQMSSLTAAVTGSGDLIASTPQGSPAVRELRLRVGGSGELQWSGDAQTITAINEGAGSIQLQGAGDSLSATLSSSGDIDASRMAVHTATLVSRGSGDLESRLANGGIATVEITGSGNVEVAGTGTVTLGSQSGSGRLVRE